MIKITLPNGSVREYEPGVTGIEIAKSLSNSLAREVLSINVDDELWDVTRPISRDASINLNKFDNEDGKHAFWHSSAHLMAEAIEAIYPGTKFGIGPAIDNGFYYDVDTGDDVVITDGDLPKIDLRLRELDLAVLVDETVDILSELECFTGKLRRLMDDRPLAVQVNVSTMHPGVDHIVYVLASHNPRIERNVHEHVAVKRETTTEGQRAELKARRCIDNG